MRRSLSGPQSPPLLSPSQWKSFRSSHFRFEPSLEYPILAKKSFAICESFEGIALQSTASQITNHFLCITNKFVRKLRTKTFESCGKVYRINFFYCEGLCYNTNKMLNKCEEKSSYCNAFKFFVLRQHSCSQEFISASLMNH